MILRCGLHVPDIARIAVELSGLERRGDVLRVADRATRGVDEPRTLLEVLQQVRVDQMARALVQGRVDRYDIALEIAAI